MSCILSLRVLTLVLAAVTSVDNALEPTPTPAEYRPESVLITEFYIDPPHSGDQDEYLELSGPSNMQFADAHAPGQFTYYLLMLENQGADAGQVDKIIKLSGTAINSEGCAWYYGESGETYPGDGGYQYQGTSENSGCTLILIAVPFGKRAPAQNHDYDATVDGVASLGGDWDPEWITLHSVGVVCNSEDAVRGGALYAPVNFVAGEFTNIAMPSEADRVNTTLYYPQQNRGAFDKIEYVGRKIEGTWFAANLTASGEGWSRKERNYRIANDDENNGEPECIDRDDQVPYRAFQDITVTLGKQPVQAGCNCGH